MFDAATTAPTVAADSGCRLGENPLWHPEERRLYWTDIPAERLHAFDPVTGQTESFAMGAVVGGFTFQADGSLLLFMARGAVKTWSRGVFRRTVIDELPEERDNRFNDVIADPEGRVYAGVLTTPARAGRLYRLDPDGRVTVLLEGLGTSNGMGFTPDLQGFYHTDTRRREIALFDYDRATGAIANRRVFARVPEEPGEGRPDGLTVDAEGGVWSARWEGGAVVRYAPDGRLLRRVPIPARRVSSVTFGGERLAELFCTTAGGDDRSAWGPLAGALFRFDAGVRGVPEFRSRVA